MKAISGPDLKAVDALDAVFAGKEETSSWATHSCVSSWVERPRTRDGLHQCAPTFVHMAGRTRRQIFDSYGGVFTRFALTPRRKQQQRRIRTKHSKTRTSVRREGTMNEKSHRNFRTHVGNPVLLFLVLILGLIVGQDSATAQTTTISTPAYQLISQRVVANQTSFYVYFDQDSGFNHAFPSGFFASPGNLGSIHIDTGCIDDPTTANGCSTNPNVLDRVHGTVMRVSFDPQTPGNFAGVNIEEPENWGVLQTGAGYDLRGANNVILDVRSPDGAGVQFGVGGCNTSFMTLPSTWTTLTIALDSLNCTPNLSDVHILFAIATNDLHAPSGATALLDNIRFDPVPTSHQSALGFPLGSQTFGVLPQQSAPIPSDQVLRNLTTIYESSLTELVLLARGTTQDLVNARLIADTFDYALNHDNHGDPLPSAPNGSVGLHNGYENGDIALFNDQQPPKEGKAGDIQLAGFTATVLCAPSGFCLVLDGATGGNNAFAILALVACFEQFGDVRYLNDAVTIGNWIVGNLTDASGTGYGGYFVGYPDMGVPPPKPLQTGKSVENNADIFAAFTALATVESELGNPSAAANWTVAANVAGDFVMQMFDSTKGSFNAGTVPVGTASGLGICPNGPQNGNDIVNTCQFLDANTFTTLAMAGAPRYASQIDWRKPIQFVLANFAQTVTAAGQTYQGFDIVQNPDSGPNGIAWEFTGQTIEAMRYVDSVYSDTGFESPAGGYLAQVAQAQISAPFGDTQGLVASTLAGGDTLPPIQQCLDTPYQCIAERVGLAATAWAIISEQELNVFSPFPTAILSPNSVTFASQPVGTTSPAQIITLSNTGNITLAIANITANGDFNQTNDCGTALASAGTCTISMTFTPTAPGTSMGRLTITDNSNGAAGSTQTVSLTGTGIEATMSLSATSLSFGSQVLNTTSAAKTVTITNTGTAPLNVTSVTASGDYAPVSTCSNPVNSGGTCKVKVTFTPTAVGTRTGTVTIVGNASNSPQTINLTGKGMVAAALSPTNVNFGSVAEGTTSAGKTITLTNNQ